MSIAIIGSGNIGAAIAKGLSQGSMIKAEDIYITDIRMEPLELMKQFNPKINTVFGDYSFVSQVDIVVIAVKPWVAEQTFSMIKPFLDYSKQVVVSVIAGVDFVDMNNVLIRENGSLPACFRVIPNTAIEIRQSMSMISACNASEEQKARILAIFNDLGKAMIIDEKLLSAGTALASCGIAYAFRYIRSAMTGGIEMGFYPSEAQEIVVQTVLGAASLIQANGTHPEVEIDKVTTPMGITIKGLNEMEMAGFTSSIIRGLKASNVK